MRAELIHPNPNTEYPYKADILFRIYPNQAIRGVFYDRQYFCGDVFCRNGSDSKFDRVAFTADHPQGIMNAVCQLLDEQHDNDVSLEIENGMENGVPYPENQDKEWFDTAITRALNGDRMFKNDSFGQDPPENYHFNAPQFHTRVFCCRQCPVYGGDHMWSKCCLHPETKPWTEQHWAVGIKDSGKIPENCPQRKLGDMILDDNFIDERILVHFSIKGWEG